MADLPRMGNLRQQRPHQRGFARTVGAYQRGELAAVDVHVYIAQQRIAAGGYRNMLQLDPAQPAVLAVHMFLMVMTMCGIIGRGYLTHERSLRRIPPDGFDNRGTARITGMRRSADCARYIHGGHARSASDARRSNPRAGWRAAAAFRYPARYWPPPDPAGC